MAVETMTQTLYADLEDLRTVVREETLLQCFDWNRDGEIDIPAVMSICLEPSSVDIDMALQTAAGIYDTPFTPPYPPALKYIALYGCQWRVSARYPTIYQVDIAGFQDKVERELTKIRKGQLSLGRKPPEASGNAIHGGATYPKLGGVTRGPVFSNSGIGKWGIF